MARGTYAPQEVTQAEVVQVRVKSEYPGQRREFSYVIRLSTADVDTGAPIMVNEYRTVASNIELSSSNALSRIIRLIEEGI